MKKLIIGVGIVAAAGVIWAALSVVGDYQFEKTDERISSGKMSSSEPLTSEEWRQIKAAE